VSKAGVPYLRGSGFWLLKPAIWFVESNYRIWYVWELSRGRSLTLPVPFMYLKTE